VELSKKTIEAFEDCETVVVNAAGCGSAMKEYGHLLREEAGWLERASEFGAKVRDVTELLAEVEPVAPRGPVPMNVAYHDPCHLAHAQGVRAEPRKLLRDIPGLELSEPAEWELCCGSAGIYNLVNPDAASELGQRKLQNLLDTGAEAVAAAQPRLRAPRSPRTRARPGASWLFHHPMERGLRRSIRGRRLSHMAATVEGSRGYEDQRAIASRRCSRRGARVRGGAAPASSTPRARSGCERAREAPGAARDSVLAAFPRLSGGDALGARGRELARGAPAVRSPGPRVEITGPTDRKMVINALNSGARGVHGRLRGLELAHVAQPVGGR